MPVRWAVHFSRIGRRHDLRFDEEALKASSYWSRNVAWNGFLSKLTCLCLVLLSPLMASRLTRFETDSQGLGRCWHRSLRPEPPVILAARRVTTLLSPGSYSCHHRSAMRHTATWSADLQDRHLLLSSLRSDAYAFIWHGNWSRTRAKLLRWSLGFKSLWDQSLAFNFFFFVAWTVVIL